MTDTPWLGDACSLVDAFRRKERSPLEELDACLAAIETSELRAFSFVDPEQARERAKVADVELPFGGVPTGVKELDSVTGWPATEASLLFSDRISHKESTHIQRIRAAGANFVGLTTASEFGGLNVSVTKLNGITGNGWNPAHTAGGSSGGSAAAVAGGLVPIATGGDGGGSIRIPAGFNGLVGMKGTYGRIPRGPETEVSPMTVVTGCLARSVRDVCRWYDAASGYDFRDPHSLPRVDNWEANLGSYDTSGLRVVVNPNLGVAVVRPEAVALIEEAASALISLAGLRRVEVEFSLPGLGYEWALANLSQLHRAIGPMWPERKDDLTTEIAFGLEIALQVFDLKMAAQVETQRTEAAERMAAVFDQADLIISATNPDVAFPAHIGLNTRVGDVTVGPENNGALTIPANIVGNPSISVPIGTVDGLPVGMQIMTRHHDDALLLDLAHVLERERPWPLVAPGAPR